MHLALSNVELTLTGPKKYKISMDAHMDPVFHADAAVLMLKNKVHRIPVVNDQQQVVGKYSLISFCSELRITALNKVTKRLIQNHKYKPHI